MPDRPYRVYRGGKDTEPREGEPVLNLPQTGESAPPDADAHPARSGPVVLPPPAGAAGSVAAPAVARPGAPPAPPPPYAPPVPPLAPAPRRRRGRLVRRILGYGLLLGILGTIGWVVLGYLAFRSAVEESNARLVARDARAVPALDRDPGLPLFNVTNILVLGGDRTGHVDSFQIMHFDPGKGLVSTISLPRDLLVANMEGGAAKLNQAYPRGKVALSVRSVKQLTGLAIHHVVFVDFTGFVDVIDAVGGIDVRSPKALRSNFDGYTYRFGRGVIHLDGRHALAYARIRKNSLDPSDSDVTRGERQQQVLQALKSKIVSPESIFRLRSLGSSVMDPIDTDLSANALMMLGWVQFRAQKRIICNLGGDPDTDSGAELGSVLIPSPQDNVRVIGEALGRTAIQSVPDRKTAPFAAACRAQ